VPQVAVRGALRDMQLAGDGGDAQSLLAVQSLGPSLPYLANFGAVDKCEPLFQAQKGPFNKIIGQRSDKNRKDENQQGKWKYFPTRRVVSAI
jgi:hypothetical protein